MASNEKNGLADHVGSAVHSTFFHERLLKKDLGSYLPARRNQVSVDVAVAKGSLLSGW